MKNGMLLFCLSCQFLVLMVLLKKFGSGFVVFFSRLATFMHLFIWRTMSELHTNFRCPVCDC